MKTKPSVTQIIGEIYPFDNTFFVKSLSEEGFSKKREKGELVPGGIAEANGKLDYEKTMGMLSSFGTVIHQSAYDLGTLGFCSALEGTMYEKHVKALHDFFVSYKARAIAAEEFVDTPEYCGISDGVYSLEINGRRRNVLLDWKTYGAYKYIYGISHEVLKKDGTPNWRKDDFKKLAIQLWMYERGMRMKERLKDLVIEEYYVAWVTQYGVFLAPVIPDGTKFHEWVDKKKQEMVPVTSLTL